MAALLIGGGIAVVLVAWLTISLLRQDRRTATRTRERRRYQAARADIQQMARRGEQEAARRALQARRRR